jgi:Lon protease-like protein
MTAELRAVPMFPLPGVVLFPGTALPLHVFEPRYKELTAAALEGSREIAIAQLRPGWDKDYHGMPPVFRVMTVGEIVDHRLLPDGRYDLILRGKFRARLQEERPAGEAPFRMALLEPIQEKYTESQDPDDLKTIEYLRAILNGLIRQKMVEFMGEAYQITAGNEVDLSSLTDILAQIFCSNPYDLQSILEETDLNRRARLVEIQVRRQLERRDGII